MSCRGRVGVRIGCCLLALLAAACSDPEDGTGSGRARIGAEGGQVRADGATLAIPAGALAEAVEIQLVSGDLGAPEIPDRVRVSRVFQVLPAGLKLLLPARLTVPYRPDALPESIPASAADLRRTDVSRALERLGALLVDEAAATIGGETLAFGTFWATAPAAPRPAWVEVLPEEKTLFVGDTVELSVEVRDQAERVMPGEPVMWESSAPGVATVDAAGIATAVGPGVAEISARAGAASGRAKLQVAVNEPFARLFEWENPLPQGNALRAVAGDGQRLVVGGEAGALLGRDAAGWQRLYSAPGVSFAAIALAGGAAVAAGEREGQGVLASLAGEQVALLTVPDTRLLAVWTDGTSGMAVGEGPNLAVLGPEGWRSEPSPASEPLLAVDGATGRPRVVGARGAVYERVGEAWISLAAGGVPQYQTAAVLRGEEAFAISRDRLRRFAGGAWGLVALPETPVLTLEAIGLAGEALVVAGADSHGDSYLLVEGEAGFAVLPLWPEQVNAVWGRSASDLYAVCESGAIYAWNGIGWSNLRRGLTSDVVGLAVYAGPRVFAAANLCDDESCTSLRGTVLERDRSGRFVEMGGPFTSRLRAIGGRGAHDLWALGEGGVNYHFQGEGWVVGSAPGPLHAITECGGSLYASGAGKLYEKGAVGWEPVYSIGWNTLRAASCGGGTLFAAGDYAIVRYRDGEGALLDPADDGLRSTAWRAVWATPEGQAFIGGDARYILFWTGSKFEYYDRPGNLDVASVQALWGRGFGDVWAAGRLAGGAGFLAHFNGAYWEPVDPGTTGAVLSVGGLEDGTLWIAGERGAILRGAPP